MAMSFAYLPLVCIAWRYAGGADGLPTWLLGVIALCSGLATMISETMFVAQMAFFNRVADPAIGGTYMTMLNTISNLGGMWPRTVALYLVERASLTAPCPPPPAHCATLADAATAGEECSCVPHVLADGYTVLCVLSVLLGAGWYFWMHSRIEALQRRPAADWLSKRSSGVKRSAA